MGRPAISVEGLAKTYVVPVREAGMGAALRSLFRRRTREVAAVDAIEFAVEPGEVVGFLGPNGAGKTTTLKMLSGLLHPTRGTAQVLGFVPWRREHAFLRQITLVMGQRNQLVWDIPVADSLERNRAIYGLDAARFRRVHRSFRRPLCPDSKRRGCSGRQTLRYLLSPRPQFPLRPTPEHDRGRAQ